MSRLSEIAARQPHPGKYHDGCGCEDTAYLLGLVRRMRPFVEKAGHFIGNTSDYPCGAIVGDRCSCGKDALLEETKEG